MRGNTNTVCKGIWPDKFVMILPQSKQLFLTDVVLPKLVTFEQALNKLHAQLVI
jgi:hypothetical protein